MGMAEERIQAWVLDEGSKGALDQGLKRIDVEPSKVRDALARLTQLLPRDDSVADGRLQQWRMTEVNLSLELSAEAGVTLVGSTTASVTGGIHVTFARVEE
jgi:hypothetical protein